MPPAKKGATISKAPGKVNREEGKEDEVMQAEGALNRDEGPQYKEQSGSLVGSYLRADAAPFTELTADEILDPNPEGTGEEELLPKNAGMREPGPFASAFKCPFRIYKNPIPIPFIWK